MIKIQLQNRAKDKQKVVVVVFTNVKEVSDLNRKLDLKKYTG